MPDELNTYADSVTTPVPDYLARIAADTHDSQDMVQMLTSPAAATLLQTLVAISGARRILEIGTFTGHSAVAMASALPSDGELITCELDPERAVFARREFDATPFADRIRIMVGPAIDSIAAVGGSFDMVFIDADKAGYPAYVDATLPRLNERGFLVLDNTLLSGGVLLAEPPGNAAIMADLNSRLAADPALVTVLLTVRDGMTIVRRRT